MSILETDNTPRLPDPSLAGRARATSVAWICILLPLLAPAMQAQSSQADVRRHVYIGTNRADNLTLQDLNRRLGEVHRRFGVVVFVLPAEAQGISWKQLMPTGSEPAAALFLDPMETRFTVMLNGPAQENVTAAGKVRIALALAAIEETDVGFNARKSAFVVAAGVLGISETVNLASISMQPPAVASAASRPPPSSAIASSSPVVANRLPVAAATSSPAARRATARGPEKPTLSLWKRVHGRIARDQKLIFLVLAGGLGVIALLGIAFFARQYARSVRGARYFARLQEQEVQPRLGGRITGGTGATLYYGTGALPPDQSAGDSASTEVRQK